jgi:hypothetical protein
MPNDLLRNRERQRLFTSESKIRAANDAANQAVRNRDGYALQLHQPRGDTQQGFLVGFSVWCTKKPIVCVAAIKPTRPSRISVQMGQAILSADADFLNTRFNHRSGIDEIANNFCCFTRAPKGTDVQGNVAPFQDY